MTIRLGQLAPDFDQDTANGSLRLFDWIGSSWALLFSYHHAFDPICTAELIEVAGLKPEWDSRNVRVIGLSADSAAQHAAWEAWVAGSPASQGTAGLTLNFPVVVDTDGSVSGLYGLIDPESDLIAASCSLFVIDPQKKVRLIQAYPPDTARNFIEILRVIDSLQQSARQGAAAPSAPASRRPGPPGTYRPRHRPEGRTYISSAIFRSGKEAIMTDNPASAHGVGAKLTAEQIASLRHPGGRPLTPDELAHVAGGGVLDWLEEAATTVGDVVVEAANATAGAATSAVDAVAKAAEETAAFVADASDAISDGVVSAMDAIESGAEFVYNDALLPLADIAENGFELVTETLEDVFEPLGAAIGDVFTGDFESAGANFQEGFENAFDAMEGVVEAATAAAGSAINAVSDLTGEAAQFLMSSVVAVGFEKMGFDGAADYTRGLGSFLNDSFDSFGDGAEVGLTSIGNAYGAFIEGAKNVPDMVNGLSQAVSNAANGNFDGALESLEGMSDIQGILAEGIGEWGKGVDGLTDAARSVTGTVGSLVGDMGQALVTLTADLTAKAGEGLGIEEAAALRSYAETVNSLIESVEGRLGSKVVGVSGMAQLDALGAAASAAALLIEGKPEEAGNQFLTQFNLGADMIKAGEVAYRSDIGQEVADTAREFGPYAQEFAETVAEKVRAAAEQARSAGDSAAGAFAGMVDTVSANARSGFTPITGSFGRVIGYPIIEPAGGIYDTDPANAVQGPFGNWMQPMTPEGAAFFQGVTAMGWFMNPNLQRDIDAYNRQLAEYSAVTVMNLAATAEVARTTLSAVSFDPAAALAQAMAETAQEFRSTGRGDPVLVAKAGLDAAIAEDPTILDMLRGPSLGGGWDMDGGFGLPRPF